MEDSKNLFLLFKIPTVTRMASSKFTDNLGMRPQKVSPALVWGFGDVIVILIQSKERLSV
jgi:hypothetical protein